ncbi:MAG TPA: hypothetical protein VJ579_03070 [Candidatus Paceibacterota bacterium]|nr:hypothetical protein [Candidatus Paceibacterota bacterium]
MSEIAHFKCNCGCGQKFPKGEARGWLILDQTPPPKHGYDLKLDEVLHFASIECLAKWSATAKAELPALQNGAKHMHPRGVIRTKNCEGFHI